MRQHILIGWVIHQLNPSFKPKCIWVSAKLVGEAIKLIEHRLVLFPCLHLRHRDPAVPMRAVRRSSASDPPPNQTGMGRCTGNGLMPAASMWRHLPLNDTDGCVHRARIDSTCSSDRAPLVWKSAPNAWYSTGFHPMPTPSRKFPPVRMSTSAACLATRAVCRWERTTTPVINSIPGTAAAKNANWIKGSGVSVLLVYGLFQP